MFSARSSGLKPRLALRPRADIVAVQHVDLIALGEQLALERQRQGRLAGAGQAGEPEHAHPCGRCAPSGPRGSRAWPTAVMLVERTVISCALVGVAVHRDDAAAHRQVVLDQDEAAGDRVLADARRAPACAWCAARPRRRRCARSASAALGRQVGGVDHVLDRLDRDRRPRACRASACSCLPIVSGLWPSQNSRALNTLLSIGALLDVAHHLAALDEDLLGRA